tara:strand:- start:283 stop:549 length:267 start_codon:yes stop_codon:yes gene_type:complete
MANKEKDDGKLTKPTIPVEKELNADSVKTQLEEKVDYHNKLVAEKERLLGELNKVESALSQNMGGINTLQSIQNEYFVQDKPSDNGEA